MEQESAKTSKAHSNSEATNESTLRAKKDTIVNLKDSALANLYFSTFEKCPGAPEAIRKQQWLTPTRLKQLQTPKKVMPTKLLDFLEPMLVHHLADTKRRTNMYVANYDVMTNALKAGFVMTKTSSKPSVAL